MMGHFYCLFLHRYTYKSDQMKQKIFLLTFLGFLLSSVAFAVNKQKDITMTAFEQNIIDETAALSLKNNTNKTIHNVSYSITYYDMKGNELDNRNFVSEVSIDPGKTKRVEIPAFEREKFYYYYESDGDGESPFKIKFELNDYNFDTDSCRGEGVVFTDSGSSNSFEGILMVAVVFIALCIIIGLYALVAVMAKHRYRSPVAWVALSIFFNPVLMIIILAAIGDSSKKYEHMLNNHS